MDGVDGVDTPSTVTTTRASAVLIKPDCFAPYSYTLSYFRCTQRLTFLTKNTILYRKDIILSYQLPIYKPLPSSNKDLSIVISLSICGKKNTNNHKNSHCNISKSQKYNSNNIETLDKIVHFPVNPSKAM